MIRIVNKLGILVIKDGLGFFEGYPMFFLIVELFFWIPMKRQVIHNYYIINP